MGMAAGVGNYLRHASVQVPEWSTRRFASNVRLPVLSQINIFLPMSKLNMPSTSNFAVKPRATFRENGSSEQSLLRQLGHPYKDRQAEGASRDITDLASTGYKLLS